MAGIEEELQGTHYRELKPYSKVPSSRVVAAFMLLPLLLSLQPRPQQHNSDNHTTTTATLYAIVAEIVISTVVIIILPLTLLELLDRSF
jgi:TctA family transporter